MLLFCLGGVLYFFPGPHSEFRSAVSWKLAEMTNSCGFLGLKASAIPVLDSDIFSISCHRWICKPWMMKDRGYPKNFEIKGGPPRYKFLYNPDPIVPHKPKGQPHRKSTQLVAILGIITTRGAISWASEPLRISRSPLYEDMPR